MPLKMTPTFSLPGSRTAHFSSFHLIMATATAIELLVKRAWYRAIAKLHKIRLQGTSPAAATASTSPATRLPPEIIEMIIAYLVDDMLSLRTCTLTCYSWYAAAAPHLHHCLLVGNFRRGKRRWPKPLRSMHALGLLPFVNTFWVRGFGMFSLNWFDGYTLHHFSALSNVQRLMIDHLDIPSFMPRIRQYFGHFLSTVRELCLTCPKGSRRQIIYFIGLFQHLEDLELTHDLLGSQGEPVDDLTLFPPFAPPLRGRLTLTYFTRVGLLKDMIDLFGGIRFRWMGLFNVEGVPLLLNACAKTLRTLRLYPIGSRGEQVSPKDVHISTNDSAASSPPRDFDLSRIESLVTLQIGVPWHTDYISTGSSLDATSSFLKYTISTITSPAFVQVGIIYGSSDFFGIGCLKHLSRPPPRGVSRAERAEEVSRHRRLFKVLREVHEARYFPLRLCAEVWDPLGEYSAGILKEAVAEETAIVGFGQFLSEPSVTYYPVKCHYS